LDGLNKDGEVFVGEEGEGIVEVSVCRAFGSTAIVAELLSCPALLSTVAESLVKRFQDLEDDQAGESGGEGIALGKTILLDEKVQCAVWSVEKTLVRGFIHKVEIMDQALKGGFRFNFSSGCFS
jgi:hypothetical protein